MRMDKQMDVSETVQKGAENCIYVIVVSFVFLWDSNMECLTLLPALGTLSSYWFPPTGWFVQF